MLYGNGDDASFSEDLVNLKSLGGSLNLLGDLHLAKKGF